MQSNFNIEQFNILEQKLYQGLGKNCFFFITPNSLSTDFPGPFTNSLAKMDQQIRQKLSKYRKDGRKMEKANLDFYVRELLKFANIVQAPLLLEYEKENLDRAVYEFLYAQHILQQLRWNEALPELALYSMEFFLPPLTEEEKLGQSKADLDLQQTLEVEMPFALMADEKGLFDLELTKARENKYHLIKSKMSLVPTIEARTEYLLLQLTDFAKRPMIGINCRKEIREIARILLQVVYDTQMAFIYSQLLDRVPLREAYMNGRGFLSSFVEQKTLEELIVFRNRREEPLDLYVLSLLSELRELHPEINSNTIKDFYGHIFNSIASFIKEGKLYPGHFFGIDIREATKTEMEEIGNDFTVTLSPVLNTGQIFNDVKEYYQVKLADEALKTLIVYATQDLDMQGYYL